jgi:hypothetical protein
MFLTKGTGVFVTDAALQWWTWQKYWNKNLFLTSVIKIVCDKCTGKVVPDFCTEKKCMLQMYWKSGTWHLYWKNELAKCIGMLVLEISSKKVYMEGSIALVHCIGSVLLYWRKVLLVIHSFTEATEVEMLLISIIQYWCTDCQYIIFKAVHHLDDYTCIVPKT